MNKFPSLKIGFLTFVLLTSLLASFVQRGNAQSVQNWSEPLNLSNSGAASNPSIVVDSTGAIHVLWVDKFDGYKYVQSTDGGATWTSPVTVKYPFSTKSATLPVLFTDASGVIHLFWINDQNELWYAEALGDNLDTPSSWRATSKLDTAVLSLHAVPDGQGGLHLGYIKNPAPAPGSAGVYYRHQTVAGGAWSSPALLYESPYFRSLTSEQARVRLASSGNADEHKTYVVWDDLPQKRVFMAISSDNGQSWEANQEIITPQSALGFKTPYHADVNVFDNTLLVTWLVGEPGSRCTPYSATSTDSGKTWSPPATILSEAAQCPESAEFLSLDPAYAVELFSMQGDLSISAWNGSQWSNPEIQTGPSSITNPATFETVLLGCKQTAASQDHLYVVGCDQGAGGDIWFLARQLDSLEGLFPLPSAWGGDVNVVKVSQTVTSVSSIPDDENNVHAFWVQASGLPTNPIEPRIIYARWTGNEWTNPAPVISDLTGQPLGLSSDIDTSHRLMLTWVNQKTGDLLFSWANSERANNPLEWIQPVLVSVTSPLTNSPDIFVDGSDRIVIVYAITLNEERGIYITQSTDVGETWSAPVRVFDAVAADWDMVDQPKVTVTQDGTLHVLFTKYTLLGGERPAGLYYAQSVDGGTTWTTPQTVSEEMVPWSEITAQNQTLHRFWQEQNNSVVSTFHEVSTDGGSTWSSPATVSNGSGIISKPAIAMDGAGTIHLLQITQEDVQTLQEWSWSNERWELSDTRKLSVPQQEGEIALASGITSQGTMYALLQLEKPLDDGVETSLLNMSRSLELTDTAQPSPALISTPGAVVSPTGMPDVLATATALPPLVSPEETQLPIKRNLIGLVLIVSVVSLILFFTVPKRNKKTS